MTEDSADAFLRFYNFVLGENILPQSELENMNKFQEEEVKTKQLHSRAKTKTIQ